MDVDKAVKWFNDGAAAFAAIPLAREEVSKAERRRAEEEEAKMALERENATLTRTRDHLKADIAAQKDQISTNDAKLAAQVAQIEANEKQLAKQEAKRAELKRLIEA
jgi:hypothetical protein